MQTVRWWQPVAMIGVGAAGLFGQRALPLGAGWHTALDVGLTLLLTAAIAWWLRRNAAALDEDAAWREEQRRAARGRPPLTPVQQRYLVAQARHARKQIHDKL